jgi:hypothetical protein
VRAYVVPRNPDTEAQRIVRRTFAEAVHSWQAMTPDDKYAFVRKARHLNMSGYNLHISQYMKTMLALKLLSGSALNPVSHDRIHSVSDTHKAGYGTKTRTGGRKKCPG